MNARSSFSGVIAAALMIASLFGIGSSASARECPDVIGRWGYGDELMVHADHGLVYASSGPRLLVIDPADPSQPEVLHELTFNAQILDMASANGRGFLVSPEQGLFIIDLEDPARPVVLEGSPWPVSGAAVAAHGDLVAVGFGIWLTVWDVSDPAEIVLLDYRRLSRGIDSLELSEDLLVISAGLDGLGLIATEDLVIGSPQGVTWLPDLMNRDAALTGSFVLVAEVSGDPGLTVVDASDPQQPTIVARLSMPAQSWGISRIGNRAYFATAKPYTLLTIDITDPLAPTVITSIELQYPEIGWTQTWDLTVVGTTPVVAAAGAGLHFIDGADENTPFVASVVDFPGYFILDVDTFRPGLLWSTSNAGYAAVSDLRFGLRVVDVSDPASPTEISNMKIPDALTYAVDVEGTTAYLTDDHHGLHVIDLGRPAEPELLASFELAGSFRTVKVVDDVAYLGSHWADNKGTPAYGLRIVDVSDPSHLTLIGELRLDAAVNAIEPRDELLFVGGGQGLLILDVSTPSAPIEVGRLTSPGVADVVATDQIVVLNHSGESPTIVDVRDLADPVVLFSRTHTFGRGTVDILHGDTLIVTMHGIIDVFDLSEFEDLPPSPVASGLDPVHLGRVRVDLSDASAVLGRHAFIANGGLSVLDIKGCR